MIDGLEEGIIETRCSIYNICDSLDEATDIQTLLGMQEWAASAYEANKVLRELALEDQDVDWEAMEQLFLIKHYVSDIYNATHRLLQRTRYD